MPKPTAFYVKLAGLTVVSLGGAVTLIYPALSSGDYKGAAGALGLAVLTALAYSLDPNHASASSANVTAALANIESPLATLAEEEVQRIADAVITAQGKQLEPIATATLKALEPAAVKLADSEIERLASALVPKVVDAMTSGGYVPVTKKPINTTDVKA